MKECFKCKEEKPLSEFYKHKRMADGHLNKCKRCTKSDSTRYRNENIDSIRAYDRERGNRQDKEYIREYREKYPKKHRAHTMVYNAINAGRLVKKPCFCGKYDTHAHHDDYNEPLNITWFCAVHHKQWHIKNGEAKNP